MAAGQLNQPARGPNTSDRRQLLGMLESSVKLDMDKILLAKLHFAYELFIQCPN